MLVANNKGNFTKKATGITFVCENGDLIERAIEESIATGRDRPSG
jgi:hypothetical protein